MLCPLKPVGDVAQLGERRVRNAKVVGSTPIVSTNRFRGGAAAKFQGFGSASSTGEASVAAPRCSTVSRCSASEKSLAARTVSSSRVR
jgi:hypothetical protein